MKSTSRWLFWLVLSRLAVCLVNGEFFILSGPEYKKSFLDKNLFFPNQRLKDMFCITDDLSSALSWNSNLEWKKSDFKDLNTIDKPYVLPNERYVYPAGDNITCQMSQNSPCSQHWSRIGNWSYVTSTTKPMSPLFDNRWEDLPEEIITDHFTLVNTIPNVGSQALSIRGAMNAHLAICNKSNPRSFCFFIIIGGWRNTRSIIRKCKDGIPEPANSIPTGECAVVLDSVDAVFLSPTEWKTFVIKWDFRTQPMISVYDSNRKILNYIETQKKNNNFPSYQKLATGEPAYYLFSRSTNPIIMKFHKYGYSLTTTTQSKLTSPKMMTASSNRNVCIEMSISLCEKCLMTIDFIDRNNKYRAGRIISNKDASNTYDLPVWINVKINKTLPVDMQQPIMLSINTLLSDSTNNLESKYWAVSNIHRCYDGAIKVTRIQAYEDDDSGYFWPNVTCQKISVDGTSSIIDSTNHEMITLKAESRPLCDEGKIGSSCSISCSKLFHENTDCHRLLICNENGCSCAQGFTMPTCDNRCPSASYGFECKKQCGNCAQGLCSYATGKCKRGCENTDKKLFLQPYCETGVESPPAPKVDLLNSTCIRVYLEHEKNYSIIPTNISFELWANSTMPAFTSEPIPVTTINIETFFERLTPGTHYKAIGILHAENKTFRGEWVNITTPCTESVNLNFVIYSNETCIIVENRVDVHVNDTCPYTWYRVQLFSGKEKLFNDSTPFPKFFTGLEANTQYKVTVSSDKTVIVNKLINTLEGAPGVVKDLHILSSSTDKIHFMWEVPMKPRGKIVNYTVEIQPIESLGCSDLGKLSYNSVASDPNESYHIQAVIKNTTQSNFNHTFDGLRPYTRYLVTVYASTAKHQGEKSMFRYSTKIIEMPTEIFDNLQLTYETSETIAANLRWSPPIDCLATTGPILASKLYIRKLNSNFTVTETNLYHYPLEKSNFIGDETYEVHLYPLRSFGGMENKTAFTSINFTMPAREPPPVRNTEIIEVDPKNKTTTLKWDSPLPPIHGKLDHYLVAFCSSKTNQCDTNGKTTVLREEFCNLWNSSRNSICKTFPLPHTDYDTIMVRAHNVNVTNGSQSINIPVIRTELLPSAPQELSMWMVHKNNATINISWTHPLIPGGRIVEFEIETQLIDSKLKLNPWKTKISALDIRTAGYQSLYNTELKLFPSSSFLISVKAVTSTGQTGMKIEKKISLPNIVNFNSTNLRVKADEDLMIVIRIPEIINDLKGSKMVVVVQGPKYCDEGPSNNEDVYSYLDTQSSSYYKVAWKAATFSEPESYANKELQIGDGQIYGDSKNYALCSKESYVIHLVLIEDLENVIGEKYASSSKNILQTLKTNPVYMGEVPKNYAMWLTPIFFIFLIAMLFILIAYRKKFTGYFLRNKPKINLPENMPLANEFGRNNKIDEVENGAKTKETKHLPYENLFIIDKKKTYLMPVNVEDFEGYFESAYKSGALNKEYATIKGGPTKPCFYGSQPEIKPKNRYANLFPYDETRVVLEKIPSDPHSDYINANFIKGYKGKEKAYIATQGPKPNTVIDFWRMIWQEKVQIICMMANLIENEKVKCEQYWPSAIGKKVLYGTISVQYSSEEVHSDYIYRTFRVCCANQEVRTVEHLHYTAWPDHGVPSNPRSIVSFLKEIQKHAPSPRKSDAPPIIVHCSAGVGRTGTLIVLDMAICRAYSENVIDVFANVLSVRKDRLNMVDNAEQYLLIHLVLVEYLNSKDTCFTCNKALPASIADAKKNTLVYYQRILETSWWNEILGSPQLPEKPLSNRNRAKHRFPETAAAINRLYLKRSIITDEDSDYIAATSVREVFKDRQYISTQLPLPSTLSDFWRMLSEQNVEYVLVLQLPDLQNPTYCELVPESQGFANTKYLRVVRQEGSKIDLQYYLNEEILIIDSSEQPTKNQIVNIISYKHWPESSLPSANDIVRLWKVVENLPKTDNPIVIACRDGVTASGMWLASSYLLRRMTIDKECDVPLAVRTVRRCRRDFIKEPNHLEYLFNVALAWFDDK